MADEAAVVGSKVAGRVASVDIDLGDSVTKGAVLARIDDEELRLQVQQTEAQLAQACAAIGLKPDDPMDKLDREQSPPVRQEKSMLQEARANLKRAEQLRDQGNIPAADYDQAVAAVAVAEARYASALNGVEEKIATIGVRRAELGLAKEALAQTIVLAPFDGLVQFRQTSPGAYVRVGDPIATLVRTNPLRFRGSVPERQALRIRVGQEVAIELEGVSQAITTRITRISPSLEAASRALIFEADVPNPDGVLRTGLFAEADVVVDPEAQSLAVPTTSVVEFAGVEKVWVVRDGEAKEQPVTTGRRHSGLVEIVSGVKAGDEILEIGASGRVGPVQAPSEAEHTGGG